MIINESNLIYNKKINEVNSVNLGNGSSIYKYGDKYYLKNGDSKKEISQDEYDKLANKGSATDTDKSSSDDYEKVNKIIDSTGFSYEDVGDPEDFENVADYLGVSPNKLVAIYSDYDDPESGPSGDTNPDYTKLYNMIKFDESAGDDVLDRGDGTSQVGRIGDKKVVATNDYGFGVIYIER